MYKNPVIKGEDISARDSHGHTRLHDATIYENSWVIIEIMKAEGVDGNALEARTNSTTFGQVEGNYTGGVFVDE